MFRRWQRERKLDVFFPAKKAQDVDDDDDDDDNNDEANTVTAVGGNNNGGNSNGRGHRQQSTKIGSNDTVTVVTEIC
jgi:hypothetical protein